ncbi:hypothetical protein Celal_3648 [Cellulophaga algicola DSM 14237]|uniref:TonB-dependent receptor plug n=1 Tax=Cellulophaga algicola (strain DSM 14237 / IC166 / ACAM 630) TaxID=688270 RepID=E6X993_CELAD|nr:hypothetical protein [Cellulophaga algicola]ADV50903.1 hypothetical protein Celal_3648 [Cellulophaga algicola DSM 14237]
MLNKLKLQYLVFFLISMPINAQVIGDNNTPESIAVLKSIGEEKVTLHYSNSTLLSGENFFFKFYCKNDKNLPSDASKIGYVELVNEDLNVVIKQKILLKDGTGYSDFFIPTNLTTGGYKLIAYTNWMKNWGIDNFFQDDIFIINPFKSQKNILELADNMEHTDLLVIKDTEYLTKNLIISLDENIIKERQKVNVKVSTTNFDLDSGSYSVFVQKVENLKFKKYKSSAIEKKEVQSTQFYIPELRGELISGFLTNNQSKEKITNQIFTFNIPGKNYQLQTLKTDNQGKFIIDFDNNSEVNFGLIELINEFDIDFNVTIDNKETIDYGKLNFIKIKLDAMLKDDIVNRSIHNQIENAYYNVRPDTIILSQKKKPFYGDLGAKYYLDDFTRFPSFKETIVEIIDDVWISNDQNGYEVLKIKSYGEQYSDGSYKPLLIVDGIRLNTIKDLINYNTQNIKSITIVREKYILGANIFSGILDIETFNGDFGKSTNYSDAIKFTINPTSPKKKYFRQAYYSDSIRIPDYRHILYWNPEFIINKKDTHFDFYTSDVKGEFIISIKGFTFSGKPVDIEKEFIVQ